MPSTHARPALGHVVVPAVRSQVTREGDATTLTLVAPTLAPPVTSRHWAASIQSQVGSPTYVLRGGWGARCTVGRTSGIVSRTPRATSSGSGGAGSPLSDHQAAPPEAPSPDQVHSYHLPSPAALPCGGGLCGSWTPP